MATRLLELDGLQAGYGRRPVLFDVGLTVAKGEIVALFGHNGAGKTTMLNSIFGRVKPTSGTITFDGQAITGTKGIVNVKRGMTLIPAEHFTFQDLTVLDNLRLGAYNESSRQVIDQRIQQSYELFPILEERSKQLAGTMSGGQQRMLSIAIALMTGPKLLLLDEPSLGLSPALVQQMMDAIGRLAKEQGLSVLMVEQNVVQTLGVVDRAYFMRGGRIILEERAEELRGRDSYWDLF
ncbi:ABC transporter ATP-binding protein [Baekduia soli]|uniref:ABC transporter ATP-binding protein n=1 Tax=Baekduia soli TaxID=496014 RepID=A0A5B8UCG6_9ACTN|nr:ABC transporter ATP-binding protein [Baekduia soli]